MIKTTYKDIFLLIALFLLPSLIFIHPIIGKLDELIFLYMLMKVIQRVILKKANVLFPIALTIYLVYSMFLIFYNTLPVANIMQIFITSKFLIIFLYFYTYSDNYKVIFFKQLIKFILFIFSISLVLSILQFILPSYFGGYSPDSRGLWGINAGGIFFGRISYSSFLLIFLIIIMSMRKNTEKVFAIVIKHRYKILLVSLILLALTFARKELVLGLLLLIYLFKDRVKKKSKLIFYIVLFFIVLFALVAFMSYYSDLNNSTFTEKQIRYLMLLSSLNIFEYYFPFGSGPGTYGSIMSIHYTAVYEAFDVPRHIYLGYGDAVRGPIFDLYFVGILAEYGMGLLLFLWFLKKMASSASSANLNKYINTKKVKISLTLQLFIIGIFVPIFLNWIGFLIFAILGTLSSKGKKNE